MFNTARIPKSICDILSRPPLSSEPDAQKIYLMIYGWCYAITVYNPTSPPQLVGVQELEKRIRSAVVDAQQRLVSGEEAICIGALTADERDRWTEVWSFAPFFSSCLFLRRICDIFWLCLPKIKGHIKSSVNPFWDSVWTAQAQRSPSPVKTLLHLTFTPSVQLTPTWLIGYSTKHIPLL